MKYPDYVRQYRPKGTVIKKVRETYYVYYATSKRVPGKNYPVQVIKGLAGKVDQYGFHPLTRAVVDTERVQVRECGFTNFLLKFEDEYVSRRNEPVKECRNLYRSMIVYLSPESYLCDDEGQKIYSAEEMVKKFHIGIPNQITAIGKMCEYDLKDLEPLKRISNVRMGERVFASELTQQQKELLEKIGVTEDEIR
ncbi:MAG: hypothetical protein LUD48_03070 [Prevotella sp.]|nr:hypothetical protein [Prevotella sp.]